MKKIIDTLVMLLVSIVLPLMFKPHLLLTWQTWIVMASAIFLTVSQPPVKLKKEETNIHDRSSVLLILISVIFIFSGSIVEMAYFSKNIISINQIPTLVGLVLIFFGFGFRNYSIQVLGKFFTTKVEILKDHELIQTGPYRILRHPSYLGAWLGVLGVTIFLHSIFGIVLCILIYFPSYIYRIQCEENALIKKFPEKYPQYQKQTWKMFPYVF